MRAAKQTASSPRTVSVNAAQPRLNKRASNSVFDVKLRDTVDWLIRKALTLRRANGDRQPPSRRENRPTMAFTITPSGI
jgi:hypothetical protein